MYEKFEALKPEKQGRILKAALREFAIHDYADASTNAIVTEAEISKGALFQYFGNKQGLYYYLFQFCYQLLRREYTGKIDLNEPDLLLRYERSWAYKMRLMQEQPHVFDFMLRALRSRPAELAEQLEELYQAAFAEALAIHRDYDQSLFRQDCAPEQLFQLIQYALVGYSDSVVQRMGDQAIDRWDLAEISKGFEDYLQLLRTCIYRKEQSHG